jgi:hypothetical protein
VDPELLRCCTSLHCHNRRDTDNIYSSSFATCFLLSRQCCVLARTTLYRLHPRCIARITAFPAFRPPAPAVLHRPLRPCLHLRICCVRITGGRRVQETATLLGLLCRYSAHVALQQCGRGGRRSRPWLRLRIRRFHRLYSGYYFVWERLSKNQTGWRKSRLLNACQNSPKCVYIFLYAFRRKRKPHLNAWPNSIFFLT